MWTVALYSMVHIVHMCVSVLCVDVPTRVCGACFGHATKLHFIRGQFPPSNSIFCYHYMPISYEIDLYFYSCRVIHVVCNVHCTEVRYGCTIYIYISVYMTGVCALCTSIQMRLEAMKSQTIQNIRTCVCCVVCDARDECVFCCCIYTISTCRSNSGWSACRSKIIEPDGDNIFHNKHHKAQALATIGCLRQCIFVNCKS